MHSSTVQTCRCLSTIGGPFTARPISSRPPAAGRSMPIWASCIIQGAAPARRCRSAMRPSCRPPATRRSRSTCTDKLRRLRVASISLNMPSAPLRIAMWSGPRNISTALMRAWGNRPDTFVCDEPLYAHYLRVTRLAHPGADEVIACHESDSRKVVAWLTDAIPDDKPVFYQKHMTHHLLAEMDRSWLGKLANCFLIRHPQEVITSYIAKNNDPTLEDVGFVQQAEIFEWVRDRADRAPPVLDAADVQKNPRRMLGLL